MTEHTGLRAVCTDREIALMALKELTTDRLTAAENREIREATRKVIASGWKGLR